MTIYELTEKIAGNGILKDAFLKEQPSDLNSLTDFAKRHGILSGALEISADVLNEIAGGMPLEGAAGACGISIKSAGKSLFNNVLSLIDGSIVIPGDPNAPHPDN